jgi:phosphatidylserine decarboxylase
MSKRWRNIIIGLLLFAALFFYPFQGAEPIHYIERESGAVKTEKVPGEFWLNWLYANPLGEASLNLLVKRKVVSDWYGKRMDSPESAKKIAPFVEEYGIDLSEAKKQEFSSFNDFFYRELKTGARPVDTAREVLVSPADGKIFAYENVDRQDFIVKGYRFNLYQYLQDSALAAQFAGGALIIVRLCPTDYHRFHFPISGHIKRETFISGDYYSVSPIALRRKIELLCMNKREYVVLQNPVFGDVVVSEIGATLVGGIVQTYKNTEVIKGREKGYFKFGGSTVLMLFEKGRIKIDADLIENTNKGIETEVKMGEKIAKRNGQI